MSRWLSTFVLWGITSTTMLSSTLQAGLIITIGNSSITAGGPGSLDVFIRSDSGTEQLTDVAFEFRIEPLNGAATQLRFANPQSDAQLADGNYLFALGSLKRDGEASLAIPASAVGAVSTTSYVRDTYIATDSAIPLLSPITVTTTNRLLAKLDLAPAGGLLAPVAGDQFRVRLQVGPFTEFLNDINSIAFSSTPGVVNVIAVPEPSPVLLLASWAAFSPMWRRRQQAN